MNDNALIAALIPIMQAGLAAQGITVGIKQSQQPTQQGAPSAPFILLHNLGGVRYGFPARSDVYDPDTETMTHTETEQILTTFQANAIAIQDPANTTALTASDYLNAAAMGLQAEMTVLALKALGLGIFRITKLRQTFFRDEKDRNEADPSFDFVISHTRTISYVIGSTADIVANIGGV